MTHTPTRVPNWPGRALGAAFAVAFIGAATLLALPAQAMPGGHGGMHGMHGAGMPMGQPQMVERMLDSVNATEDQRSQVRQLIAAARQDMQAQHGSGQALRKQAMELFSQPTVDARAAETLRQQMLAQHDAASKRMTQLMIDLSRVLTPDQRKQMAERMAQRRTMMERHRHERRQLERPQS